MWASHSRNRAVEPTSSPRCLSAGRRGGGRDARGARASCSSPRRRRGRCRGPRAAVPRSPRCRRPVDLEVHPRLGDDAEVVRGRVLVVIDVGVPASRRTTSCGWTTRWTVRPRVPSAAVTESTRRHVVGDDLDDGVATGPPLRPSGSSATLTVPTARAARGRARRGRAEEVLGLPGEQVLGRGVPVEQPHQPGDLGPRLLRAYSAAERSCWVRTGRATPTWAGSCSFADGSRHASSGAVSAYRPCSHAGQRDGGLRRRRAWWRTPGRMRRGTYGGTVTMPRPRP